MIFKVLFAFCIVAEAVLVPFFLKFSWPEKTNKSLLFKMLASTVFVCTGLLAMKISNNYSEYAKLIMIGLALGWAGDFFLHLKTKAVAVFGIGMFSFLAGHVFYIIAFQRAIGKYYPAANSVEWYEIVAVVILVGLIAMYCLKKQIKQKWFMVAGVAMYAVTISYMLTKAVRLCVSFWAYGVFDHMVALCLTVGLGALLFVLSDGSLGMILFADQKKNQKLKWFNIGTYYAAQLLLASSIFLISTFSYI